jgi:hypothetical protein
MEEKERKKKTYDDFCDDSRLSKRLAKECNNSSKGDNYTYLNDQ